MKRLLKQGIYGEVAYLGASTIADNKVTGLVFCMDDGSV